MSKKIKKILISDWSKNPMLDSDWSYDGKPEIGISRWGVRAISVWSLSVLGEVLVLHPEIAAAFNPRYDVFR